MSMNKLTPDKRASVAQVVPLVRANVKRESRLMTDEARHYVAVGKEFAGHGSVQHTKDEYVRGDIHTNPASA